MIRNFSGSIGQFEDAAVWGEGPSGIVNVVPTMLQAVATQNYAATTNYVSFVLSAARQVPTGAANKPRAWGALACAYLGQPAL